MDERPASVQEHELRRPQPGRVEQRLEQQRVAGGDPEVAAGAAHAVQVDGHVQPAALGGDVAEQEVLQDLVVAEIGVRAVVPGGVDARGGLAGRIREVEAAQVGDLELLGDRALALVALEDRRDDLGQVGIERGRRGLQVHRLQVLGAQLVLEREELGAIGSRRGEAGVVEREHQRVDVRDPAESRRCHARPHRDPVAQHRGDVGLIEDPLIVALALLRADLVAGGAEALHGLGRQRRRLGEVPQRLPGVGQLRVVGAPGDRIGLRLHAVDRERVETAIAGEVRRRQHGVRVVVDRGSRGEQASQLGVDVARRSRLRAGEEGNEHGEQHPGSRCEHGRTVSGPDQDPNGRPARC